MARRFPLFASTAWMLIASTLRVSAAYADDAAPTWDDVRATWARRAEKFKRYRVKWTEDSFVAKGFWFNSEGNSQRPDGSLIQGQDLRLKTEKTVLVDGESWRLDIVGERWNQFTESVCRFRRTELFDAERSCELDVPELDVSVDRSRAFVYGSHGTPHAPVYPMQIPVFQLGYAAHPRWGLIYDELKPLNLALKEPPRKIVGPGGRTLYELLWIESATGRENIRVALDPTHDFAILRYSLNNGNVTFELELDATGEWPARWKYQDLNSETRAVFITATMTVVSTELNPAVEPNEFKIEFPVGTFVVESLGPNMPDMEYVQRPNGERRVVTREERQRGAVDAEILATPSGQAALQRMGKESRSWGWSVAVVIVLLATGGWFWQRARR